MTIIKISKNTNGSHDNQSGVSIVPVGWAAVPDRLPVPGFPFGDATVEEINGVATVTAWKETEVPKPIVDDTIPSRAELLEMMLDSIVLDKKPDAEKAGFILRRRYEPSEHRIIWDYVPDPSYKPSGYGKDYLDPIAYATGDAVTEGLWYIDTDGDIWQAIKTGTPSGFDDTEFFDII